MTNVKLMQGNEACTLGAITAGMDFYAGYPITPSTEVAEICATELPKIGGKFIQMEDEIGSIAAIIGASLTGRKAMTATSGPGFSLMQENIGYAALTEVPIVIINVQRVGPSTGMPTSPAQSDVMQARWGTHGDHPIVVLAPGNVKECFDLTVKAFNIAEEYRVPVIVLTDEVVGHMREKVVLPEPGSVTIVDRQKPQSRANYLPFAADQDGGVPLMASFGDGFRYHVTGLFHDETGFPTNRGDIANASIRRLMRKVEKAEPLIRDYFTESTDDCELLVVAFGSSAMSSLSAVRQARAKGIKAGLFRPKTIWPFPETVLDELAGRVKRIIVPEMNMGQLVLEIQRIVGGRAPVESLTKVNGELFRPEEVLEAIVGGRK
ncbi:MAG: 2-oxoglutarate synthase subunit alpha [Spirochaetes bacterium GWD1_61_31]|nr:MAG: 2-oxoglutarate synthase subunit alpha [Spirochaetes bacterium GWB1_60_80]OHD29671.1 MAG: 2-oxoglutarate synthase subunit alpha [Spirochaetes bacterium GWC1_61_12]OHD44150.1 MAG: 2-oxoglutarate synthase subunit alpha [Spirochaetes bacterium GWD1_61_31]OHD46873.1 MAG: 2-oxoglutarate synthase subunit alpha [Spirochaetes bacterium GWE1_60_18]OHD61820.1 MAG: 2-oxoglutarate synthase subunit alpha [Spirochaetes bacterium GWF1_60_12]